MIVSVPNSDVRVYHGITSLASAGLSPKEHLNSSTALPRWHEFASKDVWGQLGALFLEAKRTMIRRKKAKCIKMQEWTCSIIAMASNLLDGLQPNSDGLQPNTHWNMMMCLSEALSMTSASASTDAPTSLARQFWSKRPLMIEPGWDFVEVKLVA